MTDSFDCGENIAHNSHLKDFDLQPSDTKNLFEMGLGGSCQTEFPGEITQYGDSNDIHFVEQTTNFTCDIVSQKMILDAFGVINPESGLPFNEKELGFDAYTHGWLNKSGTPLEYMGNMLDCYGVPNHHGEGADNMINELAQGHKVIVAVDAFELWESDNWVANEIKDLLGQSPNHALVVGDVHVTGDQAYVRVYDPGDSNGCGREYPYETFMNAWRDSNCHYVSTDQAPAEWEIEVGNHLRATGMLGNMAGSADAALDKKLFVPELKPLSFFPDASSTPHTINPNPSFSEMLDNLPLHKKVDIINKMGG